MHRQSAHQWRLHVAGMRLCSGLRASRCESRGSQLISCDRSFAWDISWPCMHAHCRHMHMPSACILDCNAGTEAVRMAHHNSCPQPPQKGNGSTIPAHHLVSDFAHGCTWYNSEINHKLRRSFTCRNTASMSVLCTWDAVPPCRGALACDHGILQSACVLSTHQANRGLVQQELIM